MATSALQRLITLEGKFKQLVCEAREYLRNVQKVLADDEVIASVCISDVDRALKLYLGRVIAEDQLQDWADVLEMCDYIDYESGVEKTIADVLFRLSTPEINEPISHGLAQTLLDELSEARGPAGSKKENGGLNQ